MENHTAPNTESTAVKKKKKKSKNSDISVATDKKVQDSRKAEAQIIHNSLKEENKQKKKNKQRLKEIKTQKRKQKKKAKALEKQKQQENAEKRESTDSMGYKLAIEYLHQWKNDKKNWGFKKVRQVWLLKHVYHDELVSPLNFPAS